MMKSTIRTFGIDDQLSIEKGPLPSFQRDRLYADLDFEQVRDDIWQDAKRQSVVENRERGSSG